MDRKTEKQLIRMLHGELAEADERLLRERLEKEEDLRSAYSSLQGLWQVLEPPPVQGVPSSYASRVVHRATTGESDAGARQAQASPLWAKAAAAVALAGGIALGVLLASPSESEEWMAWTSVESSQAEVYWDSLGQEADEQQQEDLQ